MRGGRLFTDEPQISRNGIPWSFVLPQAYKEAYGEELLRAQRALLQEGCGRARGCASGRSYGTFSSRIHETHIRMVRKRHALTGHMVLEDSLESQLAPNGACMPNYDMHIPGIDLLCRLPGSPLLPLPDLLGRAAARQTPGFERDLRPLRLGRQLRGRGGFYEWQMARGINLYASILRVLAPRNPQA